MAEKQIKKLLIITQKADKDDNVLGFMHRWITEFAKNLDHVEVVCLFEGRHDFCSKPGIGDRGSGKIANVTVHSLGKDRGCSKLHSLFRFWKLCRELSGDVDGVFVHMNSVYVLAGYPFFRAYRKKIIIWYSHREANWLLRFASLFVHKVLSVTREGFALKNTPKAVFLGHGIDTDFFSPATRPHKEFRVLAAGRISAIKRFGELIEAAGEAKKNIPDLEVLIAGAPIYASDASYLNGLKSEARARGLEKTVMFRGSVAYADMPALYRSSDLAVNLAPLGGADKTVLEAMSCAIPVIVANPAFLEDLGPYAARLMCKGSADDLANKILAIYSATDGKEMGAFLRNQVIKRHNLKNLVPSIIKQFE
jgi:glycosyltransferase involved in cell wall biosynthesis